MKYLVLTLLLISSWAFADVSGGVANPSMYLEEADGSPSSVYYKLIFPNNCITNNLNGTASLNTVTEAHLTSNYLTLAAPNQTVTQTPAFNGGVTSTGGSAWNLGTSNLTTTGTLGAGVPTFAADTDITGIIGRAKIGNLIGVNDYAAFSHYDNASLTNCALIQGAAGNTFINSAGGQVTTFNINNAGVMTLSSTGLDLLSSTLGAGAITGTSFIIGANTLTTTEWANLDGQDQGNKTTDVVQYSAANYVRADPYQRFSPTVGDAFELYAFGNQVFLTNYTDSKVLLRFDSVYNAFFESGNVVLPASGYLTFGTVAGTDGYGFRDNAGTMQVKASGGSWANFGAGGGGPTYWEYTLLPESSVLDDGSPPAITVIESTGTGTPRFRVADFDAATDEIIYFTFVLPSDYTASSSPIVDIYWFANDIGAAETCYWGIQVSATTEADIDAMSEQAVDTVLLVNEDVNTTEANRLILTSGTLTYATYMDSAAAGDTVTLRIYRDADHVSDDLSSDARLHSIHLKIPRS